MFALVYSCYRCSVDKIRRDGQRALRLLSDNVDLIVLLRYCMTRLSILTHPSKIHQDNTGRKLFTSRVDDIFLILSFMVLSFLAF